MDKEGASPPPEVEGCLGTGAATGADSGSLGAEGSSVASGSNTGRTVGGVWERVGVGCVGRVGAGGGVVVVVVGAEPVAAVKHPLSASGPRLHDSSVETKTAPKVCAVPVEKAAKSA
jgi:hypothetical protein